MKMRTLIVILLSVFMIGFVVDDAEAQRRRRKPQGKYAKRKRTSKKLSHYRGGSRGFGRFKPYAYLGANINTGNYFGDLAPINKAASTNISFTRPGFGFHAGYKFHHSMAIRAGLNWVRLYGDDFAADPNSEDSFLRYARNLSFRNDITELSLGFEFSFMPNYGGADQRQPVNGYFFLGAALFLHNPMGKVPESDFQSDNTGATPAPSAGEWVSLRDLGTEGQNLGITPAYSTTELAIPFGIGLGFRVPGTNLNLGAEFGARFTFTDYIDDVSTNYVGLDQFDDDLARIMSDRSGEPTSSQGNPREIDLLNIGNNTPHGFYSSTSLGGGFDGEIRGNPDNNDMYLMTQIRLTYFIGRLGGIKTGAKFR